MELQIFEIRIQGEIKLILKGNRKRGKKKNNSLGFIVDSSITAACNGFRSGFC